MHDDQKEKKIEKERKKEEAVNKEKMRRQNKGNNLDKEYLKKKDAK